MNDLALAARNLLRNRRRSIATMLALAIGTAAILLFGGYSKNIDYSMQTAYVRTGGHLQIQHSDFFHFGSGDPTAYGISAYEKISEAIRKDSVLGPMVYVVTPILQFGGIAGNYSKGVSRTIAGLGLRAQDQRRMRDWDDFDLQLIFPPSPLERSQADAAIIGTGLARVLHLCEPLKLSDCPEGLQPGKAQGEALPDDIAQLSANEAAATAPTKSNTSNTIEVLASNSRGAPNVAAVQVIAAERQAFKELDEVYLSLHLPQAQRLIYGTETPKVTAIMVQLHHTADIPAAQARLPVVLSASSEGQRLSVLDFRTLYPFYVQSQLLFDMIFGFIYCLIGSIVLFTIGNTMNMAVVERTVEIGTLRSMGIRSSGIRRLFVVEGLLLGVAGAVVGLVCALLIGFIVNHLSLTWLPPGSANPLPLRLSILGEYRMILGTVSGLVVIATLSAWWPARRASRLIIVDALRHA